MLCGCRRNDRTRSGGSFERNGAQKPHANGTVGARMHRSSGSCVTKVSHWDVSPEKVGGRRGAKAPWREAGDLHGGGPTAAGALSVCDMDKARVRADVSGNGNVGAFFLRHSLVFRAGGRPAFFRMGGTHSTLIFVKPWRSERRPSAFHKGGRGRAGPLPPPLPERSRGSKAERRLYNEQRKSQGGNNR